MAWSIFKQGGGPQAAVGWAQQFLTKIGAPVTPGNVQFVYQWELAEGGGGKYNPLNQGPVAGHPELTTTGEQYGGGAADFASWDAGLQGAYDFLHYKQYAGVLQGLLNNDPVSARKALWASPWAASHYGYGSNWPLSATVPGGTPILPASGGSSGEAGPTTQPTTVDTVASDDTCAWKLAGIPLTGHICVISKPQLRSLLGLTIIAVGAGVFIVGAVLLVSFGIKESSAGKAAQQAVATFVPGGKMVARS